MRKKILICDDTQEILDLFSLILEDEDYDLATEICSTKLIQRIHTEKPDLLILDLWMPVISGEQILHEIRNTLEICDLKVIVISASQDGAALAYKSLADNYIAKPFDIDDILSKINSILT